MSKEMPGVGVGVIIENDQGEILVGKRTGSHAAKYSIPGGKVEVGETFEQTSIREVREEHGIELLSPMVIAVVNDLETYHEEGVHFMSVVVHATEFTGEPQILEPDKCEELLWVNPNDLPQPHFASSQLAVKCFLDGSFYEGVAG
jgi:8-oxo-dGTP diphosphatase